MQNLMPVDRLEIRIVVDNATDILSSVKPGSESEMTGLVKRGTRLLAGRCLCCAAHGFSCLLTAYRGDAKHTILFDTGPEPSVFMQNIDRLGLDLGIVQSIVLSHGHFDHVGALREALRATYARNGSEPIPVYVHPGMFRTRAQQLPNGQMLLLEDVPNPTVMTSCGASVIETTEPVTFLDDMFHVSGEIPRTSSFEQGLPGHYSRTVDDKDWEPDPLIMDERYLVINVANKGLIVLSACSHAGLINVLTDARDKAPGIPIHAAVGGFHLSGANEAIIPQTVNALRNFDLRVIAPAHCTGWRALTTLVDVFGESVVDPSAVGKFYSF